jgi:hypothetical protein
MIALPPPAETRAIVVGLEDYSQLGEGYSALGTVSGAVDFATWLIGNGMVASNIQLWLAPANDCNGTAGVLGCHIRPFSQSEFHKTMGDPCEPLKDGKFLIVYWSGHGVAYGHEGRQLLITPEATPGQFRCFSLNNMIELFRSYGYERFQHQLWIVDACRNPVRDWGSEVVPLESHWTVSAKPAKQFIMQSCGSGETAAIDSQKGPYFTQELLEVLRTSQRKGTGAWPDFEKVLREAADRLRSSEGIPQNATFVRGFDWQGMPMSGHGMGGPDLLALLSAISWPFAKFKPYITRSLRAAIWYPEFDNLQIAIRYLADLQKDPQGVPPLCDFTARIACEVENKKQRKPLRKWLKANLTVQQLAELDTRLSGEAICAEVALWYREDEELHCMEGELTIIDAGRGGFTPVHRLAAKPVTPATIDTAVGTLLYDAYEKLGKKPLELLVEIYLPQALLPGRHDIAVVPFGQDDTLSLGKDHPTLLRCTDRYKGRIKTKRLSDYGRKILARLSNAAPDANRLWWVNEGIASEDIEAQFIRDTGAAVWLCIHPECADALDTAKGPLDVALEHGLPAVVWLSVGCPQDKIHLLEIELRKILECPVDKLRTRLTEWRVNQKMESTQSVGLLLDDPDRPPKMWAQWTQPGESLI